MSVWGKGASIRVGLRASVRALRDSRALVLCGLLAALQIAARAALTFPIAAWLEIRFDFVFLAASGMLFGPAVACLQGVAADVVGYFLRPTGAFFPGYTLSALLAGAAYGCFFYRARVTWPRALLAKGSVNLLINLGLGTLWASLFTGKGYLALLVTRFSKNLIMLPVEAALLVFTYRLLRRIRR